MQFRKQGKRIQVFAYKSYDRDKRRAKVEFMGSLDAFTFKPSDGLLDKLTVDEKAELQSYVEKGRQSAENRTKQLTLKYLHSHLDTATDSLSDDESASQYTDEDAQRLFAAWDKLVRVLRRRGYSRRPPGGSKGQAEQPEAPLLDAIPSVAERS